MLKTNYRLEKSDSLARKIDIDKQKDHLKSMRAVDIAWSFGFNLVIPQLAGVFIGLLADDKFNTKPLFTIIGLTLGLIVGCLALYRRVTTDFK